MSHSHSLSPSIRLSPSPLQRLARAWQQWVGQRRRRQRAAAQQALIERLDDATRRDLGLGEGPWPTGDTRHGGYALWQATDPYRF